jgi:hypothetical protein
VSGFRPESLPAALLIAALLAGLILWREFGMAP